MKKKIIFFLVGIIYSLFIHTNLPQENNSETKKLEKKITSHAFCPSKITIKNYDTNEFSITCKSGSNCIVEIIHEAIIMNEKKNISYEEAMKNPNFAEIWQRNNPILRSMRGDMEAAKEDNNTERIKELEKAAFSYRKKLWEEGIKYPIDHKMNYAVKKLNDDIKEAINANITIVKQPIEYIIASNAIIKAKMKEYAPSLILAFGGLYSAKVLYSLFKKQIHRNWEKKLFSWSFSPYEYNNTKKLSQLYGYSSIKRYMKDIITLLKEDKKKRILRNYEGIIFYGPPGCGKTTFVYALGAEVNVKLFTISISDILADTTSGMNKVELIFDKIAALGKKEPVILFLDEIDLLIPSRNKEMSQEEKEILQLFLTYMDGNQVDKRGVIVVGCTNKYNNLDPALKRFGRMGVSLNFPLPDKAAIIELINEIILSKNTKLSFENHNFLVENLEGKTTGEIVSVLLKLEKKIKKNKSSYITNTFLVEEVL